MYDSINQRIKSIIENSGMSLTAYAKYIGIAQTSLRDCVVNGSEPKFSTLEKLIKAEPLLNYEWLMTGNGPMKREKEDLVLRAPEIDCAALNQPSIDDRFLRIIESQQKTIEKLTEIVADKKKPDACMDAVVAGVV